MSFISGHNRHPLHGVGKSWNRTDCERLIHRLILTGYLKEELIITRDDIANSYLRVGPKAQEFLSNPNAKVCRYFKSAFLKYLVIKYLFNYFYTGVEAR